MELLPVNRLTIGVTFHPENIGPDPAGPLFTFAGDIDPFPPLPPGLPPLPSTVSGHYIAVPQGIGMIVFNLSTAPPLIGPPPPPAVFQTTPVQWLETAGDGSSTASPAFSPNMFVFQWISSTSVTLIDFNSNRLENGIEYLYHWFNLIVLFDGNTYGSDPTIINLPPDGLPGDDLP